MKKKALIIGVNGQDGSYLSEYLLSLNYEVHGLRRRSSIFNTQRIDHLLKDWHQNTNFFLHHGDLTDMTSLISIINTVKPDEIYNLGAMSHVQISFEMPLYTGEVDGLGTMRLLEAIRILGLEKTVKFYQASTSELYGKVQEVPQSETTPFYPRSPYAIAKLYSYWAVINYREAYNIFAVNGILFNHESPRRGETFVTRKITRAIASIAKGKTDLFYLGNLNSKRDWGHALDYVKGMHLMLQQDKPDDFVLATGETYTIREFIQIIFDILEVGIEFSGNGLNEICKITKENKKYKFKLNQTILKIDCRYFRPTEVDLLIGDPSKAKRILKWESETTIRELAEEMINVDLIEI
jgi:GDPmannose 4,6-dehydratase